MKTRGISWKSVVLTFVGALIFYFAAYAWLSKRQTGRGPWRVNFATNSSGTPRLIIEHSTLGISNLTIEFNAERVPPTNTTGVVAFTRPKQMTPFGAVAYDDLMFQPGIVALDCFGHLVEMAPVALGLNGVRIGWTNNTAYSLFPTNKLTAEARTNFKGGYGR